MKFIVHADIENGYRKETKDFASFAKAIWYVMASGAIRDTFRSRGDGAYEMWNEMGSRWLIAKAA